MNARESWAYFCVGVVVGSLLGALALAAAALALVGVYAHG